MRLNWPSWRWLLVGGLVVILPLAGGLDWLTWGAPFEGGGGGGGGCPA